MKRTAIDLMILEDFAEQHKEQERKRMRQKVLEWARQCVNFSFDDSTPVNITPYCQAIGFEPTRADIEWILDNL